VLNEVDILSRMVFVSFKVHKEAVVAYFKAIFLRSLGRVGRKLSKFWLRN
jgi:hypothetical protein